MGTTEATAFAPAKVNLTLHVTGQRADGYHLLDSLVMFADIGDTVTLRPADAMALTVTGPRAQGVPATETNLCWKAAQAAGQTVAITLDKHLPAAAGIGGGSSDAAATLRALETLCGTVGQTLVELQLGADVPVCRLARSARMRGIGEDVAAVTLPPVAAVLVNPGVAVFTPAVFQALPKKVNAPMTALPTEPGFEDLCTWLGAQRNDLQPPAISLQPMIATALEALAVDARLARMSGSGATCFGLYPDRASADRAAARIAARHPAWWVAATVLA